MADMPGLIVMNLWGCWLSSIPSDRLQKSSRVVVHVDCPIMLEPACSRACQALPLLHKCRQPGAMLDCRLRPDPWQDYPVRIKFHLSFALAGLRMAFYNGLLDTVVPFPGTTAVVQTLSQARAQQLERQLWYISDPNTFGSQVCTLT